MKGPKLKGYIAVEIPTKSYIAAYIIAQLGTTPKMSPDNVFGSKLYDVLAHSTNEGRKQFSNARYNTKLRVYISMHTFNHRGCNLNETNIKNFNCFVEQLIKERYRFVMDFLIDIVPSFDSNLPEIRRQLQIDDDAWSDDSIRKDYYRYRLSIGKPLLYDKKKYPATVPSEPNADVAF